MTRGVLTPEIRLKMEEFLGRSVTQSELRLLPYLQYTMVNQRQFDEKCLNKSERIILDLWSRAGYLHEDSSSGKLEITCEFWDFINSILFVAYAGGEDEESS